ncbi:MAG TPA: lactate racemase domain-containing protein [Thermoguttaceae bacterium]|nr:lactate racemase domain-containing protein [Thermoguttaceae bacterium]
MGCLLRYGLDQQGELDLDDRVLVAGDGPAWEEEPSELAASLAAALETPLGFPPLRQSTIPGDHVTLAMEEGLPHADQLVHGVVEVLQKADIAPQDITILLPAGESAPGQPDPCRLLPEQARRRVTVLRHDPKDPGSLAYLASTEAGHRVLLHRAIVDADVVIPIGCQQSDRAPDYFGLFGGVYPAFSDAQAQRRFRAWALRPRRTAEKRYLMAEVREVAWLLGSAFAVQLVPGPGDQVLEVLAGETAQVWRAGRQRYAAVWNRFVPRRARLVVAAIPGDASQQTWRSLARALAAARPLVEPGGAIAVCCALCQPPGEAVQALIDAKHPPAALKRFGANLPEDALQAIQLLQARQYAHLFMLSGLEPQLVHQLHFTPLADFNQLVQLVRRAPSCIVLLDAPHAMVRVQPPKG